MTYPVRVDVLGVPVDCVGMDLAIQTVDERIQRKIKTAVVAVNPEKVMKARRDPELLETLQSAGLLIPDGIGVVWAARLLYQKNIERVPGSELMPRICELCASKGYSIFLLGGTEEVNNAASKAIQENYPGIRIAGTRDGYFSEMQREDVTRAINNSGADIVFVALGSPKQEFWMARDFGRVNALIAQGVGGTFDVISGRVQRAPKVFRVMNLEWLYRLARQPRRLFRQSALGAYAMQLALEICKKRMGIKKPD
jgi:N-acetylglucosaminyldiphosphoundecaprenol N-acetyl-beta-D-mannosaminyltransferase